MKGLFNYILIGIIFLILVITILFCYNQGSLLQMLNGSVQSTTKYFSVMWLMPLFCILCVFSLRGVLKGRRYSVLLFILTSVFWFASGRTIAVHHTGELSSGWFYIQNHKIALWETGKCEGNVLEYTKFSNEFPLMLRYENECVNDAIYAGPFLAHKVQQNLQEYENKR